MFLLTGRGSRDIMHLIRAGANQPVSALPVDKIFTEFLNRSQRRLAMRLDHTAGVPPSGVAAGDILVLRIYAHDPAGIAEIGVQCFQFSMGGTNKVKLATGRLLVADPDYFKPSFEVGVPIPENAAFGKWGIQVITFTNYRGY